MITALGDALKGMEFSVGIAVAFQANALISL
jgi:hypothetical protein